MSSKVLAAAGSLKDGNAEWLSETCVEENVSTAENIAHLVMSQATKELNSLVKIILFNQLL